MELDLKEQLLTPKPTSVSSRPLFQGLEFRDGFKKRSHGVRSWIRVDAAGNAQMVELDKISVVRRCHLPARDLRLFDPLLVYPSTILGRESAIVVNLEQIRCIITADEVLLLNSRYVFTQYVVELQRRLNGNGAGSRNSSSYDLDDVPNGSSSTDGLAFELRALEVALDVAYTFLGAEAAELETEAYPLLDELTSKISTLNLEKVRRLKSKLVALTRRVQKVRDELDRLMDEEGDMAEMYLTEKKLHMHSTMCANHQSMASFSSTSAGISVSATSSPVSSFPTEIRPFEICVNITHSGHEGIKSRGSGKANIDELEMLLESYFIVTDSSLNKLTSLKEYIDDTEVFINIQLDNVRNQLIQFELLLTTATFVVAIFGVVAGVFGMNFSISIFDEPAAFKWVLLITGACGVFIFYAFLWFFRCKRWMPL